MWKRLFVQLATLSLVPLLLVGLVVKFGEARSEDLANKKEEAKKTKAD
ncbi:MAG: hypothetical protein ACXWJ0_08955 [Xanthobacteraceae bacterium]